jgi:hypothetical protein
MSERTLKHSLPALANICLVIWPRPFVTSIGVRSVLTIGLQIAFDETQHRYRAVLVTDLSTRTLGGASLGLSLIVVTRDALLTSSPSRIAVFGGASAVASSRAFTDDLSIELTEVCDVALAYLLVNASVNLRYFVILTVPPFYSFIPPSPTS